MSAVPNGSLEARSTLSSISEGRRVRLKGIDAGRGLAGRLAAMGLVPGVEILMVSNRGRGPAIVEVKGARLALGRGMAAKMIVQSA